MATEAQIAASRANGSRGKGPAPEARARTRMNSTKHNLSGAGDVLSEHDSREVEVRIVSFTADLGPTTDTGKALIRRMALTSYRAEVAAKHEEVAIALNVRNAVARYDEERMAEAEFLFETLREKPRTNLRLLRKSPEGVERLADAWEDLKDDLMLKAGPVWGDEQVELAALMIGLKPRHLMDRRFGDLSRAVNGNFTGLTDDNGACLDPALDADLDPEAIKEMAKAELAEEIDAQIAELIELYKTLDHKTIAIDRAEAGKRALFDASKEACLARRYEAENTRGFYKALKEFREIEAEAKARVAAHKPLPAPPPPPPTPPKSEPVSGSFRAPTRPEYFEPGLVEMESVIAQMQMVYGKDGQPLRVGQPPQDPR